jgi:hypothetical protein
MRSHVLWVEGVDSNMYVPLFLPQVCGVVTNWEPVTNPIDGTRTGFGFCEFESAEGSLRAMRLLNKLSVDGQELLVCPGCTSCMLASFIVN